MKFDVLKVKTPTKTPHGTMLADRRCDPDAPSPFALVSPGGAVLPTQWGRVASFADGTDVVELTAYSAEPVSGELEVRLLDAPQQRHGIGFFDADAMNVMLGIAPFSLQVDDGTPVVVVSASGGWSPKMRARAGSSRFTVGKQIELGAALRAVVRADLRAGSKQVDLSITIHDCSVPCRPDVYLRSIRVIPPTGWELLSSTPDGATLVEESYLVSPIEGGGEHVVPRLGSRLIRVAMAPIDSNPLQRPPAEPDGWGATRWNRAARPDSTNQLERANGFLPHSISVPDLSRFAEPNWLQLFSRAAAAMIDGGPDPSYGGSLTPADPLWPAPGIKYGGGTSGTHITQHPALAEAFFADPRARDLLRIEQIRYGSRQSGHLIDDDGSAYPLAKLMRPDRTLGVKMFNNSFVKVGDDGPIGWFAADDGQPGRCPYEFELKGWQPIDEQHLIRWFRSRVALVWLDNDPDAKAEIARQAVCCALAMWGKARGGLPYGPSNGTTWGRGEAWCIDVMATYLSFADAENDPNVAPIRDIVERCVRHLEEAQMPSGLVSKLVGGKVAQNFPLGHYFGETPPPAGSPAGTKPTPILKPCLTGAHVGTPAQAAVVGDYAGGRSNEQLYVIVAHRAARMVLGVGTARFEARMVEGLRDLAWATDPDTGELRHGVLDRYPCARLDADGRAGEPFVSRADCPTWREMTTAGPWNLIDGYDCGSAFGFGMEVGVAAGAALRGFVGSKASGMQLIAEARAALEKLPLEPGIGSWGNTLEVLQRQP